jgi:hypothetical protein
MIDVATLSQNGRTTMAHSRLALIASACLAITGCATILEGTSQSVQITTTPPGARCLVDREGARLGEVGSTPGSIRLDKSKNDIAVTCSKDGYQTATIAQSPDFQGTTFGNILIGGGVGAIADAASGANYEYPKQVTLALAPMAAPPPPPLAAAPVPRR